MICVTEISFTLFVSSFFQYFQSFLAVVDPSFILAEFNENCTQIAERVVLLSFYVSSFFCNLKPFLNITDRVFTLAIVIVDSTQVVVTGNCSLAVSSLFTYNQFFFKTLLFSHLGRF